MEYGYARTSDGMDMTGSSQTSVKFHARGPEMKGSVLRSYIEWIRENRLQDDVISMVSESTQQWMRHPPLVTTWVSMMSVLEVLDAVQRLAGRAAVRDMARESINKGLISVMMPLLTPIIRLTGATPKMLFTRLPSLSNHLQRGYSVELNDISPRNVRLVVKSDFMHETTPSLAAWEGGLEAFASLIQPGSTCTLLASTIVGDDSISEFDLRW